MALTAAVYASCPHLCRLRKTRFRWLAIPCRTGFIPARLLKGVSFCANPHLMGFSRHDEATFLSIYTNTDGVLTYENPRHLYGLYTLLAAGVIYNLLLIIYLVL
jgi:hypothetical protein